MAKLWIELRLNQYNYFQPTTTIFNYLHDGDQEDVDLDGLLAYWETNLLPLINASQSDAVLNNSLFATLHGAFARTAERANTGRGDIAGSSGIYPRPAATYYLKANVSSSYKFSDGTVVDSRRIRRGAFYLTGITDEFMADGLSVIPVAYSADVFAMTDAMADVVDVDDILYTPIVHGYALPAQAEGEHQRELPARAECYAAIVNVLFKQYTWLHSRQ